MSAARWGILAAICVVAGVLGFVLGKPSAHDPEVAPRSLAQQKSPAQPERSLAELAQPPDLTDLPEKVAVVSGMSASCIAWCIRSSQRSRSAMPMAKGACRIPRRGWPRS